MRIVSWNVNGLQTTLKDAAHRYTNASIYFSTVLHADVICFQEAKIQDEKLEKWMACVPGFESFWAFSQAKKGYSGVVTYVKDDLSPLDAAAEKLPGDEDLCQEGRIVETDHGNFVLINVYVPNAGDRGEGRPRHDFKIRFLQALKAKCDDLVRSGRHVVVVGDFNVAHKEADLHPKWKVEEIYSSEERGWLDDFLTEYVDLFRHFHPDVKDVFSVWETKTDARIHNEGFRIDYAVCDKGFMPQVKDTQILKMVPKNWSDHAAVVLSLEDQPALPQHPAPAISSRNMKRFQEDRRQKKLTALFSRGASKPVTTVNVTEATSQEEGDAAEGTSSQAKPDGEQRSLHEPPPGVDSTSHEVAEQVQESEPKQGGFTAGQDDVVLDKHGVTNEGDKDQDGHVGIQHHGSVQETSKNVENSESREEDSCRTIQASNNGNVDGSETVEVVETLDVDAPPLGVKADDAIGVDGGEGTTVTRKRPATSANGSGTAPAKQRTVTAFFQAASRGKET